MVGIDSHLTGPRLVGYPHLHELLDPEDDEEDEDGDGDNDDEYHGAR